MEKRSSSLISFLSSIDYSFIPYLSHSLLHVSPHCPRLTKRKGRDGRETQRREGKGEWVRHEGDPGSLPSLLFVPQLRSPHLCRSNFWRGDFLLSLALASLVSRIILNEDDKGMRKRQSFPRSQSHSLSFHSLTSPTI